jgi:Sec-independent protein secretion pathway component TatC
MILSGAELYLAITLAVIGLIGNLKLFLNQSDKNKKIKWSFSIYGVALIVILVGLFTPPDILSNIIFSGPLTVIYIIVLRTIVFSKRDLNHLNN